MRNKEGNGIPKMSPALLNKNLIQYMTYVIDLIKMSDQINSEHGNLVEENRRLNDLVSSLQSHKNKILAENESLITTLKNLSMPLPSDHIFISLPNSQYENLASDEKLRIIKANGKVQKNKDTILAEMFFDRFRKYVDETNKHKKKPDVDEIPFSAPSYQKFLKKLKKLYLKNKKK